MLEQVEAVQQMQDYIEAHLFDDITLADLAKCSLYSPWYSYRLFVSQIGLTPAEYIRKLRLSKSALKLRDDPCKIADVAFEMGFGSVDGYQRAFRREFHCNPSEHAAHPIHIFSTFFANLGAQSVSFSCAGPNARKMSHSIGQKVRLAQTPF